MTKSERDTIFAILLVLGPIVACAFYGVGMLFLSISVGILVVGMIVQNLLGGSLPITVKRQWQIVIVMFSISIALDICRYVKLL